jgi:signal transduction histidine kinase
VLAAGPGGGERVLPLFHDRSDLVLAFYVRGEGERLAAPGAVAQVHRRVEPGRQQRQRLSRSVRLLGTQSRRLAKLVEDLLEISRFDAGAADLRPEPVDVHALFADAVAVTGVAVEPRAIPW